MKTTTEYVIDSLKAKNIKPSNYRIWIMKYLLNKKNHPTADTIYKELIKELPMVSRTTVYNTLETFLTNNLVQLITITEGEKRFDANVSMHGHFKCENCGNIYDFLINNSDIENNILENFTIKEKHIYFKGICDKCRIR